MAELVKIDLKAIGVGVDLNTASSLLLQRVSGLNAATAKNTVAYREENGAFTLRRQLLKAPKLGPKAYEQCADFLRVPESKSSLDNTGKPVNTNMIETGIKPAGQILLPDILTSDQWICFRQAEESWVFQ